MDQKIAELLARQIASEFVAAQSAYWIVIALISAVLTAVGAWMGAYFAKRGEAKALCDGFDQIKLQLEITTRTVEAIKIDIAHDDWTQREYKTLRRVKLEALLFSASAAYDYVDDVRDHYIFDGPVPSRPNPVDTLTSIVALYFPEVNDEVQIFSQTFRTYRIRCMEVRTLRLANGADRMQILEDAKPGLNEAIHAFLDAKRALDRAAVALAPAVMGRESEE